MNNKKDKLFGISIGIFLCLIVLGLGGYYLWKYNQPSSPLLTTVVKKIDSWKVYTNNDYSFQINYPARFHFVENANLALGGSDKVAIFASSSNDHIAIRAIHDIDVYKNKKPEDVAKREIMDSGYKYNIIGVKTGNYSAAITTVENNLKDKYPIITIAHPSKNLFIELEIVIPINDSKGESDKILSSFKFTDQIGNYNNDMNDQNNLNILVTNFYKALELQDGKLLFGYFTPPSTDKEKTDFNWLTGADLPGTPVYRVFFRQKISTHKIENIQVNDTVFIVKVTDQIIGVPSAGSGNTVYTPKSRNVVLTIIKSGDKWMVDKFTDPSKSPNIGNAGSPKYNGFGQ